VTRAPAPLAGALLLLWLGPAAVAADDGDRSLPVPAEESRFDALAAELARGTAAARADSTVDEVVVIEAEEIALVAEELLEEGDATLATDLMEQALALLELPSE
jgi:hypothetical protein